jgi:hypothetical protein
MVCRVEGSGYGNIVIFFCLSFFLFILLDCLDIPPVVSRSQESHCLPCYFPFDGTRLGVHTKSYAMYMSTMEGACHKRRRKGHKPMPKGGNSVGANACLQLPRAEGAN